MEIKFDTFIFYKYRIEDWENKKIKLLEIYEKSNKHLYGNVITNWSDNKTDKNFLKNKISDILYDEITIFKKEIQISHEIDSAWFQEYEKNMDHGIHDHGIGYSSIVYIKYDPKLHYSTAFVNLKTNQEFCPEVKEGDIIFFNSKYKHYCQFNNSETSRIICAFNLKKFKINYD